MNRKLKTAGKMAVSLGLLGFILSRVDFSELMAAVKQLSIGGLSAILLLSLIFISLAAQRSRTAIADMKKVKLDLTETYIYYIRAMFYSNLLPGIIGGDVFRIYLLNRKIGDIYTAGVSVLSERICGLAATLMLSLAAAVILLIVEGYTRFLEYTFLAVLIILVFFIIIFNATAWIFIENFLKLIGLDRLSGIISRLIQSLQDLRNDKRLLFKLMLWSLCYQLSDIFIAYLLGNLVGIKSGFIFYLLFIPLVYIITLIPVSLNGLGVRENALVYFFSGIGILETRVLLLSLLIYLDRLLKGILGGLAGVILKGENG